MSSLRLIRRCQIKVTDRRSEIRGAEPLWHSLSIFRVNQLFDLLLGLDLGHRSLNKIPVGLCSRLQAFFWPFWENYKIAQLGIIWRENPMI